MIFCSHEIPTILFPTGFFRFGALSLSLSEKTTTLQTLSQTNKGKSIPLSTLVGQMYQNQGVAGFYRGVNVNVMRAVVLNATKMGVYDVAKGRVVAGTGWARKDPRTAFCSSFLAGFFMTCTVAPFDICRTRLMNQPADKPKVYFNLFDTFAKIATQEGPLALWRGFIPMWARIAPTTTLQLLFFEKFTKLAGISAT